MKSGITAYDDSPNKDKHIGTIKRLLESKVSPFDLANHLDKLNDALEQDINLYREMAKLSPLVFVINDFGIAGSFIMLGYAVQSELYLMRGVKMYKENKKLIEDAVNKLDDLI